MAAGALNFTRGDWRSPLDLLPPFTQVSKVGSIHDYDGGVQRQLRGDLRWLALTNHERDLPATEVSADFHQSFQQEGEVPGVGLRVVGFETEADHLGHAQLVGLRDGKLKRSIAVGTSRLLHPERT